MKDLSILHILLSWTRQHQIVTYYYNVIKNLQRQRLCLSAKYTVLSLTTNTMFFSLRGQPFDSEGGGGLALFGNKYAGLEKSWK